MITDYDYCPVAPIVNHQCSIPYSVFRFVTMEDQLKGVQIQIHSDYRDKITNVTLEETVEVDYGKLIQVAARYDPRDYLRGAIIIT